MHDASRLQIPQSIVKHNARYLHEMRHAKLVKVLIRNFCLFKRVNCAEVFNEHTFETVWFAQPIKTHKTSTQGHHTCGSSQQVFMHAYLTLHRATCNDEQYGTESSGPNHYETFCCWMNCLCQRLFAKICCWMNCLCQRLFAKMPKSQISWAPFWTHNRLTMWTVLVSMLYNISVGILNHSSHMHSQTQLRKLWQTHVLLSTLLVLAWSLCVWRFCDVYYLANVTCSTCDNGPTWFHRSYGRRNWVSFQSFKVQ